MSDRFRPTRAGVINVWDYVDEEWMFAGGRLALRGHNGSGKTKALEVLFPFVLDGVADSRRLDPFSGENRTMKSNLLYRGQESEYGYVWMEFARPAPPRARDRHADHRDAGAPQHRRRADVVLRHRPAARRGLRPAVGGLSPADRTAAPGRAGTGRLAQDRDRVPGPGGRPAVRPRPGAVRPAARPAARAAPPAAGQGPRPGQGVGHADRRTEPGRRRTWCSRPRATSRTWPRCRSCSTTSPRPTRPSRTSSRTTPPTCGPTCGSSWTGCRPGSTRRPGTPEGSSRPPRATGGRSRPNGRPRPSGRPGATRASSCRAAWQGLKNSEEYKAQGRIEDKRREVLAGAREVAGQRTGSAGTAVSSARPRGRRASSSRRAAEARAAEAKFAAEPGRRRPASGIADDGFGPVDSGDDLLLRPGRGSRPAATTWARSAGCCRRSGTQAGASADVRPRPQGAAEQEQARAAEQVAEQARAGRRRPAGAGSPGRPLGRHLDRLDPASSDSALELPAT